MKKYLLGSDVEKDKTKEKARLLGIAHELYVQRVQDNNTNYIPEEYATMYGGKLKKKKGVEEYALEYEDTAKDLEKMQSKHKSKIKDILEGEWDNI